MDYPQRPAPAPMVMPASCATLQRAASPSAFRACSMALALRDRLEVLRALLAEQVQSLPLGNESWIETERELRAAETAMAHLGGWRWI
ncbi:MAG: hypothetical protein ACOVNL_12480 [Prochlorococcaceae cyanobacterium]|jgi:hypothetical protein